MNKANVLFACSIAFFALMSAACLKDNVPDPESSQNSLLQDSQENAVKKIEEPSIMIQIEQIPEPEEPEDLEVFRKCYPDVVFDAEYDEEKEDWKISIEAPIFPGREEMKHTVLYWADGRLLPEDKLGDMDSYWKLIYNYNKEIKDPSEFTEEEIERARNFGSSDNRMNQSGTPMFFYDFLYAAKSRVVIEDHIIHTTFLGKKTKVHERIKDVLKDVEKNIRKEADNDPDVKAFVDSLKSADAYNWRIIDGTDRKSFHSYGIAIDVLPRKLGGRTIFWGWEKERNPKNWMTVPLKNRWLPPAKVIEIFADAGFIWGGNWMIYDNMHFEYHPELFAKYF